ncbi:hypothetical protein H072_4682 [Dactylellina haptotyla CBS 200.50]|uniref:F-box domain-containing protein n=1 Tax=Dactylellina haptotyla (strain CBS 200.50) TaxID=1284197 RepID=S8AJW5_DACHA|nr:hypothetical protein H072_4682 [Dactylellina haptotyla CBS 200.50]
MESPTATPLLLTLPLEIRELIYLHLVGVCQVRPEPTLRDILLGTPRHITYNHYWRPASQQSQSYNGYRPRFQNSIFFPLDLPQYSLLPILQTCRQIRAEVQDFIHIQGTAADRPESSPNKAEIKLSYILDVNAWYHELFPEWRSLPVPPEAPYNVIPEFRINYNVSGFLPIVHHKARTRYYNNGELWDEAFDISFLLNFMFWHGPQGFYLERLNGRPDVNLYRGKWSRGNPMTDPDGNGSEEGVSGQGGGDGVESEDDVAARAIFQEWVEEFKGLTLYDGDDRIPGGRCQLYVKKLVFNFTFTYDNEVLRQIQTLEAERDFEKEAGVSADTSTEETAAAKLEAYLASLESWKNEVLRNGYQKFLQQFIARKFLDNMVEKVVMLYDGVEKWDGFPGMETRCEFDVPGRERKVAYVEEDTSNGIGLRTFNWGPVYRFQRNSDYVPIHE